MARQTTSWLPGIFKRDVIEGFKFQVQKASESPWWDFLTERLRFHRCRISMYWHFSSTRQIHRDGCFNNEGRRYLVDWKVLQVSIICHEVQIFIVINQSCHRHSRLLSAIFRAYFEFHHDKWYWALRRRCLSATDSSNARLRRSCIAGLCSGIQTDEILRLEGLSCTVGAWALPSAAQSASGGRYLRCWVWSCPEGSGWPGSGACVGYEWPDDSIVGSTAVHWCW